MYFWSIKTTFMSAISKVLVFLIMLTAVIDTTTAQNRRSEPTTSLGEKLWYGGNVGLGFQSFNNSSSFLFALFPMVGYKITDNLSIGPRVGAAYQHLRSTARDGTIYKFNPVEISGAIFSRVKVIPQIFGHIEYEIATDKQSFQNANGIPQIASRSVNNFYIGAGYTSGGRIASEISLLYNVLDDGTTLNSPLVIRGGFTYRF